MFTVCVLLAHCILYFKFNDESDYSSETSENVEFDHLENKNKCRKSQVALAQFKGHQGTEQNGKLQGTPTKSKSIQVLLLLIQHGANGLNILEAQHVILVEPLLNPAAEAQAINRVHRIGQDKKTFVHRFIVSTCHLPLFNQLWFNGAVSFCLYVDLLALDRLAVL